MCLRPYQPSARSVAIKSSPRKSDALATRRCAARNAKRFSLPPRFNATVPRAGSLIVTAIRGGTIHANCRRGTCSENNEDDGYEYHQHEPADIAGGFFARLLMWVCPVQIVPTGVPGTCCPSCKRGWLNAQSPAILAVIFVCR